jgi:hypothetical protein
VCAGVNDLFVAGHEITASSSAQTGAQHFWTQSIAFRSIDIHCKYLVALYIPRFIVRLKHEHFSVETEIGLGIISSESELRNIF